MASESGRSGKDQPGRISSLVIRVYDTGKILTQGSDVYEDSVGLIVRNGDFYQGKITEKVS